MELLEAIYQRRAVRAYTSQPVPAILVEGMIQAAAQAPSALNLQPWAFAVIHGRSRLADYSRRAKAHLLAVSDPVISLDSRIDLYDDPTVNIFHEADTLILICAKPGRFQPVEDCFLAAQNLMLAAHGLGFGSCPVGFARPWFNLPAIKAELGLPQAHIPVLPVVVGFPDAVPGPARRNEAEITVWHWDE